MLKVLDVSEKHVMTQNIEAKLSESSMAWKIEPWNPF